MSTGPTHERITALFAAGAESISIAAGRRDSTEVKAKSYTVVIKRRGSLVGWGHGILANPNAAFDRAFTEFTTFAHKPAAAASRRIGLLS